MLSREAHHGRWTGRPVVRPLIRIATALAAVCAALAVAGCGSDSEDEGDTAGSTGTGLEVTLDIDGEGGKPARTMQCGSSTCNGPLSASDFEPVPPATPCTEIFGGPETATITGTLDGESVEARLSRANGCEIERFDRFIALLQELFPDYTPGQALQP